MTTGGGLFAGVELGGTKCVCVLGDAKGRIIDRCQFATTTPAATLGAIDAALDGWRAMPGFAALGIGSFGPLDLDPASPMFGSITTTPKPGWAGTDLAGRWRDRYGVPLAIDTDVTGAALAEGRWGAARGLTSWAYVTVGTGVGAGVIVNGQPVAGLAHAEAGHVRVGRLAGDDWPGACSFHGDCVEGLASGPAIAARTGTAGGTLAADDPVWESVAHALAGLVATLALVAAPQRVLIGGGVVTGRPDLFPRLRTHLRARLAGYVAALPDAAIEAYVVPPGLGDRAGPLGAIALALDAR